MRRTGCQQTRECPTLSYSNTMPPPAAPNPPNNPQPPKCISPRKDSGPNYIFLLTVFFSPRSAGGVFVVGGGGKIELNNTYEERLKMCETEALPTIRATLFGENANRKFKN